MRIISLELKNIRSYRSAKIDFPEGITLLSGDIGVGKSTLLLAIEFALFGLSRDLVGNALLRHGNADGNVTLTFETDQKYTIHRQLRRTPSGAVQDNGWIEVGGARENLTPSELRARIFELLNYPLQFLGKKNLLYRFTIYTPQEEMKSILVQESEERLEIIRRIFGIDTYRIARENAHLLAKALKEREAGRENVLPRLQQEKEYLGQKLAKSDVLAQQRISLQQDREQKKKELEQEESGLMKLESQHASLQQKQQTQMMQERNRKLLEQEVKQLEGQLERKTKMLRETSDLVVKLQTTRKLFNEEITQATADELQQRILTAQAEVERLKEEEGKIIGILEHCHAPDLVPGTVCPTCQQKVSAEHLEELRHSLDAQSNAANKKRQRVNEKLTSNRELLAKLASDLERRRQIADITTQLTLQEKILGQHQEDARLIQLTIDEKRKQVKEQAIDVSLQEKLRNAEQQSLETRIRVQRVRQQVIDTERQLARIEQEEKDLDEARKRLAVVEQDFAATSALIEQDARIRSWLTRQFTPFTSTVERHVLVSIHATFDAVFRQWFSRLIEDDALSTRINHEFAPVMTQHGYETDVQYLSGGERTAVSLAYRLSLVHAIHVLLPHLATAGVIMLDEPTDGFSEEQLERVRDVLRDLRMHQIILVSHEQQLEGFVDHIIRISKTGDGSVIDVSA